MNATHSKTRHLFGLASALAALTGSTSGWAAMPATAVLSIDAGSNFTMEVSPGFHLPTAITGFQGLKTFVPQDASGSHTGAPNGSESPGIDNPWAFFGNTGMHYTTTSATIVSDDGAGTVILDLSGWGVTWNGISRITMGTGAWGTNANGQAIVTCAATCADGESYSLYYTATVPVGDPSGFGGVAYGLNLVGTITAIASVGTDGSSGTPVLADGAQGGTAANDYQISLASLPTDSAYDAITSVYDFSVSGLGAGGTAVVTLNLGQTIPAAAVYRKYTAASGWVTFDTTGGDTIESGMAVSGSCLAISGVTYSAGLTAGNNCIRLTIADGGLNDADGAADGTVFDPGLVAIPAAAEYVETRTSGSSGCTLADRPLPVSRGGDWLLVGLALAGLAFFRRRAA